MEPVITTLEAVVGVVVLLSSLPKHPVISDTKSIMTIRRPNLLDIV
jgi:hypothetical protein